MSVIDSDYLTFDKEDFQRGVLIQNVGWHPVKITSYEKKKTKDGLNDLHVYLLEGMDEDSSRKGLGLRFQTSSNAPKVFHARLVMALDPTAAKTPGFKYSPEAAQGKIVEAYIEHRRMDQSDPDSLVNNVKDFRPVQS